MDIGSRVRSREARCAIQASSCHSYESVRCTIEPVPGDCSILNANGSVFFRNCPSRVTISYWYSAPGAISGRKSSHTPLDPIMRIGWMRPSHPLNCPTTLTRCALGAHTANAVPSTPSCTIGCAPSFVHRRRWVPSLKRWRSTSPSVGRKR